MSDTQTPPPLPTPPPIPTQVILQQAAPSLLGILLTLVVAVVRCFVFIDLDVSGD